MDDWPFMCRIRIPFCHRLASAGDVLAARVTSESSTFTAEIVRVQCWPRTRCSSTAMSTFGLLKEELDRAIVGVNRYNPNNVEMLEKCIEAMVQENQYDKDILVTTLKLYQLNADKYNEAIVKLILLKTMMMAPRSDYALAKYLIDSSRVGSPELKRVFDIGALLESCNFAVFWRLMRGEYRPVDDVCEPFRQPGEIPKIVRTVPGFEESVRNYACQVISVTYQNIEKSLLVRLLGGISEKHVSEYARRYGWVPKENGEVFFVQNHEATIKSRNIEEKLQFEACVDLLRTCC